MAVKSRQDCQSLVRLVNRMVKQYTQMTKAIPAYQEAIVKVPAEKIEVPSEVPLDIHEETKETSNLSNYTTVKHRS